MRMSRRWTIDITPRPGAWRLPTLISIIVGAAHGASFAPLASWWTQLIALALLVGIVARADTPRIAWLSGYGFGLGWFGIGVYWLYISMHDYGHMPWWAAGSAVVLFCACLAIYPALAVGLWWRLRARLAPAWQAVAFALLWAGSEWLRATLFTGFPWIGTGYAHVDGPLAGYAPIGGVYVVGLLAALVAAAFALVLDSAMASERLRAPRNRRTAAITAGVATVVLVAGAGLRLVHWTAPVGKPISVRLLQGNVAQETKFDPQRVVAEYQNYYDLIQDRPAELVVLPETAFPLPIQDSPPGFFDALAQRVRAWDTTIISGIFVMETGSDPDLPMYTNAAIAISPQTPVPIVDHEKLPVYRKHHLVPFGEFIPLGFRWFVDIMQIPIGDQQQGAVSQASFPVARADGSTLLIGMNICYEDYFGDQIAIALQRPDAPNVLVNLTNLGWFGDTTAIPQHVLASRMRAIETGRPMLRATNSGGTAYITPDGHVVDQLPAFVRTSLAVSVQGMSGITPYARWLDLPFLILCVTGLAFTVWLARRR